MQKTIFILFSILFLLSCTTTADFSKKTDTTDYYSSSSLTPLYYLYHSSENSSKLFYNINPTEVLFTRESPEKPFQSALRFEILISMKIEKRFVVLDTVFKTIITQNQTDTQTIISGEINLPLSADKNYKLTINCIDSNKNKSVQTEINTDKTSKTNRHNYLVTVKETSTPIFNYQKSGSDSLNIECNRCGDNKISIYEINTTELKLPPPPYANRKTFLPELPEETIETTYFEENHAYFISSDKNKKEGITIAVHNKYFPEIKTYSEMALTTRYITTKSEYEELNSGKNRKKSIDDFWIKCGGSTERGKQIISIYYSRVAMANTNFSSINPGWKTDRGTIFIIYGKPNEIRKNTGRETWIYGDVTNPNSLSFTFYKKNNIYTENQYELARNSAYRIHWQRAVTNWINGRIYERK